jgi:predicted SnoaL-like aldol condensation-catalyzing enzyme
MRAAIVTFLLALLIGGPALAQNSPAEEANKAVVTDFYVNGIHARNADVALKHLAPGMVEHNPRVPAGPTGLRDFLSRMPRPAGPPKILRTIADGPYVVLHVHAQRSPEDRGMQIIEMFRLENGKIAEHWDIMQQVPETMANGAPPF